MRVTFLIESEKDRRDLEKVLTMVGATIRDIVYKHSFRPRIVEFNAKGITISPGLSIREKNSAKTGRKLGKAS